MLKGNLLCLTILALNTALSSSTFAQPSTLINLSDEQLAETTGQALMSLSYIAPTDKANLETARNGGDKNIGFYKLGMEAELELNTNIKRLQLGCGGVNGSGACDIDIENLSLSGLKLDAKGEPLDMTREERAQSSAKLTNPFIEFAVKNPGSASTREIKGFRVSAEKVVGLMTLGLSNDDTPSYGIRSLSGYLKLASASGTAKTIERPMTQAIGDMTGRISIQNAFPLSSSPRNFVSDKFNLTLYEASVPFSTAPIVVSGSRMSKVNLNATAVIPQIDFAGPLDATINVAGFIPITLGKNVTGKITNLTADITIDESLGMIHKIPVNGNPFSLSLQSQKIQWANAAAPAERGWWMAFENDIKLGDVTPSKGIKIEDALLKQVLPKVNDYLYANYITCNGYSGCLGGDLPITDPINLSGQRVTLPLENLKLGAQSFQPNCYGSLKFC
ncbi:hypothetical protein [Acinetobacter wuhouensis]|uniref:hypothetical protein n=2 Tax=Acinetobacter TaxID=469 RepID=UPI001D195CCB|nr:hypothetical protein [Acinetobacter wuhouensis]